jgi:hypothetical protein
LATVGESKLLYGAFTREILFGDRDDPAALFVGGIVLFFVGLVLRNNRLPAAPRQPGRAKRDGPF